MGYLISNPEFCQSTSHTGIEYDWLRYRALIVARDFLESGDISNAEKYLKKAYTYEKLSDLSFDAASDVFLANLEVAEIIAQSIKDGCQTAVTFGLRFVSPTAAEAADFVYDVIDLGIEYHLGDQEKAVKDFIVKQAIGVVFNEVRFGELGRKTIAEWTENRTGKYLFPMLSKLTESEEWQWALSKVIKEGVAEITEDKLTDIASSITDEAIKTINFLKAKRRSPVELRVYDSQDRVTGLINGEVKAEIPGSVYDTGSVYDNGAVTIFFPTDVYRYEVVGTDEGKYGLDIASSKDAETTIFTATEIPTSANAVHQYIVDWDVLSKGEEGVTVQIDSEGDGTFEETINTGATFGSISLTLSKGWNLISIPVQLPDNAIGAALQSISGLLNSVWRWVNDPTHPSGGYWMLYAPGSPIISDLETLDPGNGYWIYMKDAAILTLSAQAPGDEPIQLKQGWNLVGYKGRTSQPVEDALFSIAGHFSSAWAWICDPTHANGGYWKLYAQGLPIISDLETLEPGMGLWIRAMDNCEWNINSGIQPAPASSPVAAELRRNYISSHRPEIPYIIWGRAEIDGVKMTGRDTTRHAPMLLLKVDDKVQSSYQLGTVRRYGDFYRLEVPETDGSAQIELYVQVDDIVVKAAPVPPGMPGQIIRLDLSVQLPPKVSILHQNYPNPFNPGTWIPYQLKEDAHVEIRIYTATGKLVRTMNLGHKPAGVYTDREKAAYWDGKNEAGEYVATGIYFYSIKAGDLAATRKMVLRK